MKRIVFTINLILTLIILAGLFDACSSVPDEKKSGSVTNLIENSVYPSAFSLYADVDGSDSPVSGWIQIDNGQYFNVDVYQNTIAVFIEGQTNGYHEYKYLISLASGNILTNHGFFSADTNIACLTNLSCPVLLYTNTGGFSISADFLNAGNIGFMNIYRDGGLLSSASTPSQFLLNDSGVSEGFHHYHAVLLPVSGNTNSFVDYFVRVDFTPPFLANSFPENGANDVSLTAPMTLDWSEPITTNNLSSLVVLEKLGVQQPASVSLSSDRKRVTVTPAQPLESGATYNLIVSNEIKDLAGNNSGTVITNTFSSLFPPLSTNAVFNGTGTIDVLYPTNGTIDFRNIASHIQWAVNPGMYKYYCLIFNAAPDVQGSTIVNRFNAVKYWSSDIGKGVTGNIDIVNDTMDMTNGNVSSTNTAIYQNNQVYYIIIYGISRNYQIVASSPVYLVRW
jgi:hypothetical protein